MPAKILKITSAPIDFGIYIKVVPVSNMAPSIFVDENLNSLVLPVFVFSSYPILIASMNWYQNKFLFGMSSHTNEVLGFSASAE